jgi:hypothetical protein
LAARPDACRGAGPFDHDLAVGRRGGSSGHTGDRRASVVSVTDEKGGRHEPASGRYTPLVLALPPGDYRIEVRNPSFPNLAAASVSVRASDVTTRVLEFRRLDAAEYFKRTGL